MHLYFSTGNGQPREPALCQLYRQTLSFPIAPVRTLFLLLRPESIAMSVSFCLYVPDRVA